MKIRKNLFFSLLVLFCILGGMAFKTSNPPPPACTEYSAFINQYGMGDPSVTVLTDTLGSTMSWGRYSTGFYSVWSTAQLPLENTLILTSGTRGFIRAVRDPNEIFFYTWNPANVLADGILNNTWVYIRVCD